MPLYEYQCEACEGRYVLLIRNREIEEKRSCPACGGEDARKLVSPVTVAWSESHKREDRRRALGAADPTRPQQVARYFKDHGSRFGDDDFRGTDAWKDTVDRVAEGGPTLEE